MQTFMRHFDGSLQCAKELFDEDAIGCPFKIVSVLADPLPPSVGHNSAGLLSDMSGLNVDEVR